MGRRFAYDRLARTLAARGECEQRLGVDRAAQRDGRIYSGIDGIQLQDQAITESMGPITSHELEHLAPSDQMITRTRRRLLTAARALRDKGGLPPGVENVDVYRDARSGYFASADQSPSPTAAHCPPTASTARPLPRTSTRSMPRAASTAVASS
jgi:hypothetical protein